MEQVVEAIGAHLMSVFWSDIFSRSWGSNFFSNDCLVSEDCQFVLNSLSSIWILFSGIGSWTMTM